MIKACKKCRREGEKLLLKGERCLSQKCAVLKRAYAPGQHGQSFHGKSSEFGKQLREKQKAKRIYGIAERQFASYVEMAGKTQGNKPENLVRILETRLDNVVFRSGWASSRSQARQMISHRLFKVNNSKVNIPSYIVTVGEVVEPVNKTAFQENKNSGIPTWLDLDVKKVNSTVKHLPVRDEIDTTLNENLIIEYYSR